MPEESEKTEKKNQMPLLIDCLVIKKRADLVIKNEIGRHFRMYNVIEYKLPRDALTIDDVSKVQAYAHLFKSYGGRVDASKFSDITVTLIRDAKSRALFKYFEENGYKVTNPGNWIYYVEGNLTFPMQIIVGRELSSEDHKWLHLLTCRATELDLEDMNIRDSEIKEVLKKSRGLSEQEACAYPQ